MSSRLTSADLAKLTGKPVAAPTSYRTKRARGSRVSGKKTGMNKLEAAWAKKLAVDKLAGAVAEYWFEQVTLVLITGRYTPDFMVQLPDGTIEFHECKGFWERQGRQKFLDAAAKYPFVFRAIKKVKGQVVVVETLGDNA